MCGLSGSILVLVVLVAPVWGQSPPAWPLRLRFFDCAVVQFFGVACAPTTDAPLTPPTSAPKAAASAPTPAWPPTESGPPAADAVPADTAVPPGPLFTSETVSPDTPPLLLRLLQEPTEANARAFLAWYQARLARVQAVQALLDALSATATDTPSLPVSPGQATLGQPQEQP